MDSVDFFSIQVEQTDWRSHGALLARLRRTVFVDEQGVPESEELDGLDESAIHWVAWGPQNEPMGTARLVGDCIGRMAVLEPFRNKGVGSALLRAVIQYALHTNMEQIRLSAQIPAIPFYRDNCFEVCSEEFEDAGISHRQMVLNLSRFKQRRYSPALPDVSAEDRARVPLDGVEAFREKALELVRGSHRCIQIFSHHLEPGIYDNEAICTAIYEIATQHANAKIQLLVRDPLWLSQNHHRLIHLYHRLTSHIQVRQHNREISTLHTDFMITDSTGILYKQEEDRFVGYAISYAPVEARELAEDFDLLWENGLVDPEIRRLHI